MTLAFYPWVSLAHRRAITAECRRHDGAECTWKASRVGRSSVYGSLDRRLVELRRALDAVAPWSREHGDTPETSHIAKAAGVVELGELIRFSVRWRGT